jgi:hypothetical protein
MKTQIVLPDSVAEALKAVVPPRKRSQFITEALEAKLRALTFQRVLKMAAGSWTDRNHPDLKTQADINRFLARFRGRFGRRG